MSTPLTLLYGSLSPHIDSEDVVTLYRAVLAAPRRAEVRDELIAIHARLRSDSIIEAPETPGEQGSILGEAFYATHVSSADSKSAPVDVEAILAEMGVWTGDVAISDTLTRGVSVLASDGTVGVLVNQSYRGGRTSAVRRFTLAHELAHLVVDQEYSRELVVASGPWAPVEIEKRGNAFAAALLMPTRVIGQARAALAGDLRSEDGLRALARALDVSFSALVNRLQNLGLLSFGDAEHYRGERP